MNNSDERPEHSQRIPGITSTLTFEKNFSRHPVNVFRLKTQVNIPISLRNSSKECAHKSTTMAFPFHLRRCFRPSKTFSGSAFTFSAILTVKNQVPAPKSSILAFNGSFGGTNKSSIIFSTILFIPLSSR